jgi:hypothetical protein
MSKKVVSAAPVEAPGVVAAPGLGQLEWADELERRLLTMEVPPDETAESAELYMQIGVLEAAHRKLLDEQGSLRSVLTEAARAGDKKKLMSLKKRLRDIPFDLFVSELELLRAELVHRKARVVISVSNRKKMEARMLEKAAEVEAAAREHMARQQEHTHLLTIGAQFLAEVQNLHADVHQLEGRIEELISKQSKWGDL